MYVEKVCTTTPAWNRAHFAVIAALMMTNANEGSVHHHTDKIQWEVTQLQRATYRGSAAMVSNPERGFRFEIDNGCDRGGITADQIGMGCNKNAL